MGFSSSSTSGSIQADTDVALSNPVTGHVLSYNSSVSKWQNAVVSLPAKRVITASYASTLTPNGTTTDIYRVILAGALTLQVPSGTPTDGQQIQIHLIQDGTGSRLVTFNSGYAFSTSIPTPALSTTANAIDVLGFQYNSATSSWLLLGAVIGF